jgi:uncharacterized protein YyaL (SSP411 family)
MAKNRLAQEKSPYLLQHAENPVDWYPWSEEAFKKAAEEDKPVFLSIGYSTCHWCHVMEKESFMDEEAAQLLNDAFVCIKVDREERPDIDGIYMRVCQMLTGSGGWPLTIIMTPDKKPFFAGTYFPKESRFGRIGILELVPRIKEIWHTKRIEIIQSSNEIANAISSVSIDKNEEVFTEDTLHFAFREFQSKYDKQNGGFGSAPKFPSPHNIIFLLRYWKKTGKMEALNMVVNTLEQMRLGGIYDHAGFGFHRYSTDAQWLVPHFEKMLYDQALLSLAYIDAYQASGNNLFRKTAEEILEYVSRDMTSEDGAFYSAEDADSEGEEGKFYLWTEQEIDSIFTLQDSVLVKKIFNIKSEGNWIDPMGGSNNGTNILHLKDNYTNLSRQLNINEESLMQKVDTLRKKLYEVRKQRIHPYKDDKILTDWNGLMISAFARAVSVFNNEKYLNIAEKSLSFFLNTMMKPTGELLHRFRDDEAAISGFLDDYAFLVQALLDLFEASGKTYYLQQAVQLNSVMIDKFFDSQNGGFFFSPNDGEELISRQKEIYDGAIPSGNSVAIMNLLRLSKITGDNKFERMADSSMKPFVSQILNAPIYFSQFLSALSFAIGPSYEIVIVGDKSETIMEKMTNYINNTYVPHKVLIIKDQNDNLLEQLAPYTADMKLINGKPAVYICKNFMCNLPITEFDDLKNYIEITLAR